MGVRTTLQDIITIAKYGIDSIYNGADKIANSKPGNYSYSSSAKAASNLIAVFPVLCSSNVKPSTASLMTKTIERKGCVSLQLAITSVNINSVESGIEYFRQFHQNIKGGGTVNDYENMINNYLKNESVTFNLTTAQTDEFVQMLKELYVEKYESNYNNLSLNDYIVDESFGGYTVTVNRYKELNILKEASPRGTTVSGGKTPELKDSDAKKANEAVPSLMIISFFNKEAKTNTEFIIGVKAKLIPTDYMEILGKVYTKNKDGKGLVNLIRATTGEINVITDYLLAIDKSRDDILAMRKKGSKESIWKTLENRAVKSKWLLRQGKVNYASSITTVVITSEDADYLYKEENIDVYNVQEAKKFMQAYNLFGFIVVNEAEESASFMYDEEEPYFEKLSYTMLERESSDGQYKKIVNLISKMR